MLFLDSSEPAEIEDLFGWGVLSGVTTNPLILAREARGVDLGARVQAILRASRGPVSVELVSETEAEMLAEAQRYRAFERASGEAGAGRPAPTTESAPSIRVSADPPSKSRICIKVPFSEVGLRVTSALAGLGVPTNVTCLMSFHQAYLAALAGATFVSIFSGRVRDMGYDPAPVIAETRRQLDRESLGSKLIVGSVRHLFDVSEALGAGAHVVTVPPPILRKMLRHPRTEETIREFNSAWREASAAAPAPTAPRKQGRSGTDR